MRSARLRFAGHGPAVNLMFGQLLGLSLLTLGLGLVMVLSSSSIDSFNSSDNFFGVFLRQSAAALVGVPLMLLIARRPAEFWSRFANLVFLLTAAFQALVVLTPLGSVRGGNRNWIDVGPVTVQPSEFLKLGMVLWLARQLSDPRLDRTNPKQLALRILPGVAVALGLVMLGHDLGTAAIMVMIVASCLFFARIPLRFLMLAAGATAIALLVAAQADQSRTSRISAWLSQGECTDYMDTCWQSLHGTWALAAGGLFGVGLGNSKSKWAWLPAAENDFIFAVIGEELGLIGALVVVVLFVVLAMLLVRLIAQRSATFDQVVTAGALAWLVGQAFVNIAVVLGLLPILGVPLPLVSNGGSALVANLAMMGVVLSIARNGR